MNEWMNPKRPIVKGVVSWNRTSTPFYKLVTDGKFFRTSFLQLCFNTCFDKGTCSQACSPDTEQGHTGLKRLSKWNRWLAFHTHLQNWQSKIIFHIQVILKKTCRGRACTPCSFAFSLLSQNGQTRFNKYSKTLLVTSFKRNPAL